MATSPRRRRATLVAGLIGASLVATSLALGPAAGAVPVVRVLYAGSLATINDQVLGPAFSRADGIGYQGQGDATLALAREIVGGELTADLFESVGTGGLRAVGPKLMPWAVSIASQPLVVMYNPKSRWAPEFQAIASGKRPLRDLFALLGTRGLRLGRTDPETDPQGQAFVLMVHLATRLYHLPPDTPRRVLGPLENPAQVFAETALPAELQAGGVDAASGFLPQAIELRLPYIALPPALDFAVAREAKTYAQASIVLPTTHRRVVGAPLAIWAGPLFEPGSHAALGVRYLEFVMSAQGQADLRKNGFTPLSLPVYGRADLLPKALASELRRDARR